MAETIDWTSFWKQLTEDVRERLDAREVARELGAIARRHRLAQLRERREHFGELPRLVERAQVEDLLQALCACGRAGG